MKLRYWISVLLVLALFCGCAGAEGAFSGASYDAGLAVVGGEVYCAAKNAGLGFIPIWRVSMAGLEKAYSRIGGWRNLYALGDELLTIEPVLNIGEMLGSVPTSTYKARRIECATGKVQDVAVCTGNEDGVYNVFAAQGRAYRDMREVDAHTLQRLDDGNWTTVAQWAGDHAWVYETFCVIGDRNAKKAEYVALYEFATGKTYDVTDMMNRGLLWSTMEAVLEDGVLYHLDDRWFAALTLSTGEKEMLVKLPAEMEAFILTDNQLLLMSRKKQEAWLLDRNTCEIIQKVEMTNYPQNAVLNDGRLFVRCIYGDAGVEIIDLTTGESVHYPL